jgi:hypothetical protein
MQILRLIDKLFRDADAVILSGVGEKTVKYSIILKPENPSIFNPITKNRFCSKLWKTGRNNCSPTLTKNSIVCAVAITIINIDDSAHG